MEHEAEKYQQRLQAITEKRRLQEEQERAKREIEDERLRLQQLKRKSLRDQWLMEGPPTSPDSTSPRSPLWGSKAQEIETRINKLQETSERLAEEEVKLKEHIEDGFDLTNSDAQPHDKEQEEAEPAETPVHSVSEQTTLVTETVPNGPVVENGKDEKKDESVHAENHNSEEAEAVIDVEVKAAETTTTAAVINGSVEEETSHKTSEEEEEEEEEAAPHTNGLHPAEGVGAGGVTMTFLGFKEAEPGQGTDEDYDAVALIRAERVIITDEGEEIVEEDDGETQESATSDANEEESDPIGVWEETEIHPELKQDETPEAHRNEASSAKVVVTDMSVEEEQREGQERPDSQTQNQTETLDAAVEVSQAPVCSTTQPSPPARSKTEATESRLPKEVKAVANPRISLSEFQEVPLDGGETLEAATKTGGKRQPAEQHPLLASKTAAQTDTSSPNRAEDAGAPKRKTCQCCSVM
ncbi:paralemmin-3 isoform X2 [Triplophysa rosa]|uniref:paralemmin-3 isoform X2 n=1 Tax=Triplophysa rosa TaxID=992332 RepID=UPI00254610B0|nr:paralemmin-3 isoform X2 [Triplophysa rosa]